MLMDGVCFMITGAPSILFGPSSAERFRFGSRICVLQKNGNEHQTNARGSVAAPVTPKFRFWTLSGQTWML
jgi:hypothetical protein